MKRGATKEEIIRTTLDLITRNGLRAVRVDEIAQMLGISKRTLYEMFADKNDLISACLNDMARQQRQHIDADRKRRSGNALQKTLRLVNTYVDSLYRVFCRTSGTRSSSPSITTNTANSGSGNWRATSTYAATKGSCSPRSIPVRWPSS